MKEKLIFKFGKFGLVIFYLLLLSIYLMPFVMIDLSIWIEALLLIVYRFFPITELFFWIWGLICTIMGQQDIFAIIYYILFTVLALPHVVLTFLSLFAKHE